MLKGETEKKMYAKLSTTRIQIAPLYNFSHNELYHCKNRTNNVVASINFSSALKKHFLTRDDRLLEATAPVSR